MVDIELLRIAPDKKRDIICGRAVGRQASETYGIGKALDPGETIQIIVPDHVRVVTSSFFVGFLSRSLASVNSLSEARRRVTVINASDITKENLYRALSNCITTREPLYF